MGRIVPVEDDMVHLRRPNFTRVDHVAQKMSGDRFEIIDECGASYVVWLDIPAARELYREWQADGFGYDQEQHNPFYNRGRQV